MKKAISTLLALVLGLSLAVLPVSALELEEAKELRKAGIEEEEMHECMV